LALKALGIKELNIMKYLKHSTNKLDD